MTTQSLQDFNAGSDRVQSLHCSDRTDEEECIMEEEGAVLAVVIWQISMCVKNYGRASKAATELDSRNGPRGQVFALQKKLSFNLLPGPISLTDSTVSFLFCFLIILLSTLSDRKKRKERNIIKLHGTSICATVVDHSC